MSLLPLPADLPEMCHLRRCDAAAVGVQEIIGHPNGDMRAGYCAEHLSERFSGMWAESPSTYRIVFSGPYLPRYGA